MNSWYSLHAYWYLLKNHDLVSTQMIHKKLCEFTLIEKRTKVLINRSFFTIEG
jgi:hypothetical protein